MAFSEFGPFAIAFEDGGLSAPGHLVLLNLMTGEEAQLVIEKIYGAMASGQSQLWIDALLAERDWRPHLPAAIAFLLDRGLTLQREPLWRAIDAGSWVTPQLAVVAYFSDPCFAASATLRLNRFAAQPDGLPESEGQANAPKIIASLLGVFALDPALKESVAKWKSVPAIQVLLGQGDAWDINDIVASWMAAVRAQFAIRGVTLTPPTLSGAV
jgi:hypothetical protein